MIRTLLTLPAMLSALLLAGSASAGPLADLVRDGVIKPIDPAAVTVSGTSSGAYMALQYAVSHPEQVIGFGMIAGGPYMCAGTGFVLLPGGTSGAALTDCMEGPVPEWKARDSVSYANDTLGSQAARAKFRTMRAWIFRGQLDRTVREGVFTALQDFLKEMGVREVVPKSDTQVAHAHVISDYNRATDRKCPKNEEEAARDDYIGECDVDAAGEILAHTNGWRAPERARLASTPTPLAFHQQEYGIYAGISFAAEGMVYVPAVCRTESCRLHIAFHGCRQGDDGDGTDPAGFAKRGGYNQWAEAYRTVVLYPRVKASWPVGTLGEPAGYHGPIVNPRGCWDWWGYSDAGFWTAGTYARPLGGQISAVAAMVRDLAGGVLPPVR